MTLKEAKADIRQFLRDSYSDSDLVAALAHAIDRKLSLYSCCCFVGIPTADHPLRTQGEAIGEHYIHARYSLPNALDAELAFRYLGGGYQDGDLRRRRLIPMLRAEIRRRGNRSLESARQIEVDPVYTF